MDSDKRHHMERIREELGKQTTLKEFWLSQIRIVAVRANTFTSARRVLEIGSGTGVLRDFLEPRMEYSGIDPIECKGAAFDFKIGNAESIPYSDGTFDLVLIKDTANYFRALEPAIREASRVLAPNGVILMTEHVGATYHPGTQKVKNLVKKYLHLRRNVWDKTYSNYYTSHDIIKAANKVGLATSYEYAPADLRYFVTIRRVI